MFDTVNDIKDEIADLFPYFKEMAEHIISLDMDNISKLDPPDACYPSLRSSRDNDMIARANRLSDYFKDAAQDFFDPPGVTIDRAYNAATAMTTILKAQERLTEFYGQPWSYIDGKRNQSGKTVFDSIQDTVKSVYSDLLKAAQSFGISTEIDNDFVSDWGFIENIADKYQKAAVKIAAATPEMYATMADRGAKVGSSNRNSPEIERATQIRTKYENSSNGSDLKNELARAAKGVCWAAAVMDLSRQWMGQPAQISAFKDEFLQERQRAEKAVSMITTCSNRIRAKINEAKELVMDVELDKPNAERRLRDIALNQRQGENVDMKDAVINPSSENAVNEQRSARAVHSSHLDFSTFLDQLDLSDSTADEKQGRYYSNIAVASAEKVGKESAIKSSSNGLDDSYKEKARALFGSKHRSKPDMNRQNENLGHKNREMVNSMRFDA